MNKKPNEKELFFASMSVLGQTAKVNCIIGIIVFSTFIVACGGVSVSKPFVLQNAESYTANGLQAYKESDWEQAQRLFSRALSLYSGIDDQHGVLISLINLTEVSLSLRDYPTAKRYLDSAENIVKQASLSQYQRRVILLSIQKALQQNQISQAEILLQSLLPEFDHVVPSVIPDAIQITSIANRTKVAFAQQLNETLWIQRYENALKLAANKNPELEARLLRFQSSWLQHQGNYQQSELHLQQALEKYKDNLLRSGIAVTLAELGQLNMDQSRWQEAQDYFNRSIAVYLQLKDREKVVYIAENQVLVALKLGDLDHSKALKQWISQLKDQINHLPAKQFD